MATPFIVILCAVFFTSILSGVLGMAGGMVLMGVLLWLLPVQQAMILHAVAQFFANGSRAFIHREHIVYRALAPYFLGMAAVLALAVVVSFIPDKRLVLFILGVMPFAAYAVPKKMALDFLKPLHGFICGALVTTAHVTAGVSGPLLDIFFQSQSMNRHQNVATKAFTQAASHVAKFIYFGFLLGAAGDAFAGITPLFCAAIVLMAVAGTALSRHILSRISDKQFYKITQVVLFIIGAVYLVQAATYDGARIKLYESEVVVMGADWSENIMPGWLLLPSQHAAGWPDAALFRDGKVRTALIAVGAEQEKRDLAALERVLMSRGIRPVFLLASDVAGRADEVMADNAVTLAKTDTAGCALERAIIEAVIANKNLRDIFDVPALAWRVKNSKDCK
jgi:uncharacterized membrane protein YfcA